MTTGTGATREGRGGSAAATDLSVPGLISAALERSEHASWGSQGFTEPLRLLVESSVATGRLSPAGARVLRSVMIRHLRNRLYVQAFLERRPEVASVPLDRAIVITGLPRTGTSLLHSLLAQDRRHRFLPLWQALHPVPPGHVDAFDETALVRQAETWLGRFYLMAPGFRAIHPLTPEGPEECDALLQNAFASLHFDDMFDAEAYSRWFHTTDLDREYEYYALQLRVLSSGPDAGKPWVLKSPGHLGQLEALRRVLPQARIVHCHRDPARAVPSYASLIQTVRAPNSERLSPSRLGEQALWRTATGMERALTARSAEVGDAFFDVPFADLAANPIDTVARIYAWLEAPLDPGAEASMRRWLAANPPDRHGVHEYDAGHFSLSPERMTDSFARYLDRFESLCAPRRVS